MMNKKKAFRTCYRYFKYIIILFRLTNTPITFQAYINKTLSDMLDLCMVVYLDNILIYSINKEDYKRNICIVLDRLKTYNLYYKLNKCAFNINIVNFLSFIVSLKDIYIKPAYIETVEQWPEPTYIKDI